MVWVLALLGFAFAAILAFANASMRRWIITGYVGLLIAFFAFPLTETLGALSRGFCFSCTLAYCSFGWSWLIPLSP
jgi:hypothetical protein